ncbi:hypothetical protein C0J52_05640 [Blattella germanica]|nr:hypothetical protein C0J52_05640 [Blattella germanica]
MPAMLNCEAQSICLYNCLFYLYFIHFIFSGLVCTGFTPRTKTLTRPLKSYVAYLIHK